MVPEPPSNVRTAYNAKRAPRTLDREAVRSPADPVASTRRLAADRRTQRGSFLVLTSVSWRALLERVRTQ